MLSGAALAVFGFALAPAVAHADDDQDDGRDDDGAQDDDGRYDDGRDDDGGAGDDGAGYDGAGDDDDRGPAPVGGVEAGHGGSGGQHGLVLPLSLTGGGVLAAGGAPAARRVLSRQEQ